MSTISNSEIKLVRSLASKKGRKESGLFLVEGEKMVSEALDSDMKVRRVWRSSEIGEDTMGHISALTTPSPALAVVEIPSGDSPVLSDTGLYLALDDIRDPGNMGTILRIADWFGIDGVFASGGCVDLYNPKTVQATMGAIFRVKFKTVDLCGLCKSVISQGGSVYGTFLSGSNIYETRFQDGSSSPVVIVIGNESEGISDEVAQCVSERISIPPFPAGRHGSESLNAAVATAITVAEFRRRAAGGSI